MEPFKTVRPNHFNLPRRIERLEELAYNLWWTWSPDVHRLFDHIDGVLWEETYHNPILFLRQVERPNLNAVIDNLYLLELYDHIMKDFDSYMSSKNTWMDQNYPGILDKTIAYFSMEFGLHETLPIYAGGLGILSGDHLKEASDLGLPLVAVGFFYTQGYFTQEITEDGWQEARYTTHPFEDLPVMPVLLDNGERLTITVNLSGRDVKVGLWEVRVGRVPLYLLDSNIEENSETDKQLTCRLYGSDMELRISQEILLGIGGVRALRALGYHPSVWHMNEGHSAFLVLERICEYVKDGISFAEAAEIVRKGDVFTTHTPVPAGNDEFPLWLIDKYFSSIWRNLGLDREQFVDLARHTVSWGETFSMPMLALKYSERRNAVSELHGHVSRKMWNFMWQDLPADEVPITHITNGVHTITWMARRYQKLYDEYFGSDWVDHIDDPKLWEMVLDIPDDKIWEIHRHLKRKLAAYIRERSRSRWVQCKWHPIQAIASGVILDPDTLTIGFARRFAPYKRADLVLSDLDRLLGIINQAETPVQIIFAGKSHPDSEPGKKLIQRVYQAVKNCSNGGRLVFLEDYDMNLAHYLVQGVDVWMNTPRRPNEACGTSGQKAAMNGVLNFSVLDGWWREAYNRKNGWKIGKDKDYDDPGLQDKVDSESLYNTLENEIIPLYYMIRTSDGLPGEWIARMKESIRTLTPRFSTRRMVKEYYHRMYLPAIEECPHEKNNE